MASEGAKGNGDYPEIGKISERIPACSTVGYSIGNPRYLCSRLVRNTETTRDVALRTQAAVNTTSAVVSRTEAALHATSEVVLEV